MKDIELAKKALMLEVPAFSLKVKPIYDLLQWKWTSVEGNKVRNKVPSVEEIEETLYGLIGDLNKKCVSSATGGFIAKIVKEDGCGDYDYVCIEMVISKPVYQHQWGK